jgi:endonuclease/exonuclease/phosphatase family metal-dependent hydrolase
MSIRFASWNVEGRLSGYVEDGRGSVEQILEGIEMLNADVVVLPEAFLEEPADGVDDHLTKMGYEIHDVAYGDKDRDWSQEFMGKMNYLRVLSRLAMSQIEQVAWADTRQLCSFRVTDPETGNEMLVLPTHLDDRSEAQRLNQVDDAAMYVEEADMPTVMLGDFNAMWRRKRARFFGSRIMRLVARHIPHERMRNKAIQFTDMATGLTLERLASVGLMDADTKLRPTVTPKMRAAPFMPSLPLGQIDHILITKELEAAHYDVSRDRGSDHRAVTATISVKVS